MATNVETTPAGEQAEKEQVSRKRPWCKWLKRVSAAVLAAAVAYHALILLRVFQLRASNPSTTAFIDARARESIERGAQPRREQIWVNYDQVSPHLVRAVIAAEDPWFNYHSGVDIISVKKAILRNWKEKRIVQGGSTIDQQLAKNLFLSASRNPLRKLHETLIALEMEQLLGKRRVMEIYLNVIEWGDGIYGAEAAARHYFNTSAATLDQQQAAFLAVILPNPLDGNTPDNQTERVRLRANALKVQIEQFAHIIDGRSSQDSSK